MFLCFLWSSWLCLNCFSAFLYFLSAPLFSQQSSHQTFVGRHRFGSPTLLRHSAQLILWPLQILKSPIQCSPFTIERVAILIWLCRVLADSSLYILRLSNTSVGYRRLIQYHFGYIYFSLLLYNNLHLRWHKRTLFNRVS